MKRMRSIIITIVVASGVLSMGGCFGLAPIDVAGTWSGLITWTSGPATTFTSPLNLTLEQEKTQITDQIGLMGPGSKPFSIPIVDGTSGSSQFTIHASGVMDVVTPPVNVKVDLQGKRNSKGLSGTGTQTNGGVAYTFDWRVTLQASPK